MAKKKDEMPQPKTEEKKVNSKPEVQEKPKPVEKVEAKTEPKVEAPAPKPVVPIWKRCNRCGSEMAQVSVDGFERLLECPKCKAHKSVC